MKTLDWYGLYGEGWQNEIVGEAFSHPAKFSRALIRRIYEYAIERGWLAEGDEVLDPFAGVALGALDAMFQGLHWIGVELEEKFVGLGQGYDCDGKVASESDGKLLGTKCGFMVDHDPHRVEGNIELWNRRYSRMPRWGTAVLLQGDSRELAAVLGGARAKGIVASPPYSGSHIGAEDNPYIHSKRLGNTRNAAKIVTGNENYSTNPLNLGNMPTGDVDAVISSPPYANRRPEASGGGVNLEKQYETYRAQGGGASFEKFCRTQRLHSQDYGQSPGQLAAMPEGAFEATAVVSSPPWESTKDAQRTCNEEGTRARQATSERGQYITKYGLTMGQLGNTQGDTFWSAARVIVQQCHQVLVPGGVAIWVLKSFVRNKQIVNFPNQWRQMCEACGFETLEWIRAWLVEDRGAQYALNGDLVEREVRRESFFRRLHRQKYPELSIDFEVVLVMRKAI